MRITASLETKKEFAAKLRALADELDNDVALDNGFIKEYHYTPETEIDGMKFQVGYKELSIHAEFTILPGTKEWRMQDKG